MKLFVNDLFGHLQWYRRLVGGLWVKRLKGEPPGFWIQYDPISELAHALMLQDGRIEAEDYRRRAFGREG